MRVIIVGIYAKRLQEGIALHNATDPYRGRKLKSVLFFGFMIVLARVDASLATPSLDAATSCFFLARSASRKLVAARVRIGKWEYLGFGEARESEG